MLVIILPTLIVRFNENCLGSPIGYDIFFMKCLKIFFRLNFGFSRFDFWFIFSSFLLLKARQAQV